MNNFFLCTVLALIWATAVHLLEDVDAKIGDIKASDIINPKKWWSFVKGSVLEYFLQPHILEQILIRQIECAPCVEAGKCLHCGCKMPAKTFDLNAVCSEGHWVEVEKDAAKYKARKEKFKIKLNVSYGT